MQFGHLFWQQTPDFSMPHDVRLNQVLDLATGCEDAGFDSIWFAEQHFTNYGYSPNPVLIATAAAQRTRRVRIGLSIVVLPLWNPVRLAEDLALLDIFSNGRLDVGIGKGYQHIAFRGLGVDIDTRQARFEESLDVLLRAWTTDELQLAGPTWVTQQAVNVLPKPVQRPHPPIWVAVTSDDNIRWAATTDFHVFGSANWVTNQRGLSDHELYLQERRAAGRSDDRWSYALNRQTRVLAQGEDRDEAWRVFADRCRYTFRLARRLRRDTVRYERGIVHSDVIEDEPTDAELRERTLFGTPDEIAERVVKLHATLDTDLIITQMDFGGAPHEEVRRSVELFGTEVIPAVRSALPAETT
ncbi:LLM class flavin-dependent oxidoreductase [Pseudonocardia benzenivorans]|jgi:alkanesulfonate monooxygenase SsuD/methylene tetrahydromethanopterin reductase-like flavin-dependent oxidoreductase (luciferase family)|uniref:LLM class flavin-dependent oxidoreductase n=1 Tax=Pseudonocardia benzenivorans TaxID=228005 RepID=A0ABW3VJE0_9PSEU|nr:luciferase [Pseudonocardia sp. D17]